MLSWSSADVADQGGRRDVGRAVRQATATAGSATELSCATGAATVRHHPCVPEISIVASLAPLSAFAGRPPPPPPYVLACSTTLHHHRGHRRVGQLGDGIILDERSGHGAPAESVDRASAAASAERLVEPPLRARVVDPVRHLPDLECRDAGEARTRAGPASPPSPRPDRRARRRREPLFRWAAPQPPGTQPAQPPEAPGPDPRVRCAAFAGEIAQMSSYTASRPRTRSPTLYGSIRHRAGDADLDNGRHGVPGERVGRVHRGLDGTDSTAEGARPVTDDPELESVAATTRIRSSAATRSILRRPRKRRPARNCQTQHEAPRKRRSSGIFAVQDPRLRVAQPPNCANLESPPKRRECGALQGFSSGGDDQGDAALFRGFSVQDPRLRGS